MENLSNVLCRERELLATLLYRLDIEQLMLQRTATDHLARAARDIESTLEDLRCIEVLRAVAVDEAAAGLGASVGTDLRVLAEESPEPWRAMLLDHADVVVRFGLQVAELADASRGSVTNGLRSAQETLRALGAGSGDDPEPAGGRPAAAGPRAVRTLSRTP